MDVKQSFYDAGVDQYVGHSDLIPSYCGYHRRIRRHLYGGIRKVDEYLRQDRPRCGGNACRHPVHRLRHFWYDFLRAAIWLGVYAARRCDHDGDDDHAAHHAHDGGGAQSRARFFPRRFVCARRGQAAHHLPYHPPRGGAGHRIGHYLRAWPRGRRNDGADVYGGFRYQCGRPFGAYGTRKYAYCIYVYAHQ